MPTTVIVRGGGDLASGVILRLHHAGIRVLVAELAQPLMVRRAVSFAEAVYAGEVLVEGTRGVRIEKSDELEDLLAAGSVPVIVDPALTQLSALVHGVVIDARMTKQPPDAVSNVAELVVGLGPGFTAGQNCHAVIETMRGHDLGRVLWEGAAAPDTGIPGSVAQYNKDRVLRAPADGHLSTSAEIGQQFKAGELIASVAGQELLAPFDGALRGLIHPSVPLTAGMKIGDLDPRNDPSYCFRVSDKALAIGGGVLEALLTRPEIRAGLWA